MTTAKTPVQILNERARELRDEPDMPEKSLRWYRKLILDAQTMLIRVMFTAHLDNDMKRYNERDK